MAANNKNKNWSIQHNPLHISYLPNAFSIIVISLFYTIFVVTKYLIINIIFIRLHERTRISYADKEGPCELFGSLYMFRRIYCTSQRSIAILQKNNDSPKSILWRSAGVKYYNTKRLSNYIHLVNFYTIASKHLSEISYIFGYLLAYTVWCSLNCMGRTNSIARRMIDYISMVIYHIWYLYIHGDISNDIYLYLHVGIIW